MTNNGLSMSGEGDRGMKPRARVAGYVTGCVTGRVAAAAVIGLLMAGGGCQVKSNTPPEVVNETPMITDPAMARRDWPKQSLVYESTNVATWPTRYYLEAKDKVKDEQRLFLEPVLFVVQTAAWPIAVVVDRPFGRSDVWRGETVMETYSGAPVLKPDYAYDSPPTTRPVTVLESKPYHESRPTISATGGGRP